MVGKGWRSLRARELAPPCNCVRKQRQWLSEGDDDDLDFERVTYEEPVGHPGREV